MKQIPIIRFSQFDNKWSSIAIGNLAQIKRGASPRPIQDPKWFDKNSGIGWLRISDVTEQNGRIKYLEQKISKLGQEKTRVLNTPHLLLSIAATVGKPVVNYVKTGVHDGFLIFENPKFDREFMFQWFDMFRPKWNKYGQPGSQVNLNSDIIRNHKMMIPSLPEQQVIGSLFRTLDDLLASYKDNLANYQSLKATMLTKMFPKAGQIVPEIRLDGFEGEWEKYYLGDVFEQVSNYIEPSVENELWSLTVEKGLTPKTDRYKRDFLVKKNDKFKKVDLNEFVYNPMNLTLGALDLNNNEVTISVSGYYVVIKNRDIEKFDNDFLKILLKTTYAIYQYKQFATGTLIEKQRVQFPTFSEIPFYLPPIAEQQAIGAYFSNLDNLINSRQEKIFHLETLKKKLLQNMFI